MSTAVLNARVCKFARHFRGERTFYCQSVNKFLSSKQTLSIWRNSIEINNKFINNLLKLDLAIFIVILAIDYVLLNIIGVGG